MKSDGIQETAIITTVLSLVTAGAFGSFGAMIHYLYLVVKGEHQYSFKNMLIYMILGLFVGILADYIMRDFFGVSYEGVVLISGFLTIKVLDFLNANGLQILVKKAGIDVEKVAKKEEK